MKKVCHREYPVVLACKAYKMCAKAASYNILCFLLFTSNLLSKLLVGIGTIVTDEVFASALRRSLKTQIDRGT
jgi:hypothetical protein